MGCVIIESFTSTTRRRSPYLKRMGSASDGVGGYEVTDRDAAFAVRAALGL